MASYDVQVVVYSWLTVSANSEEEAYEVAEQEYSNGETGVLDYHEMSDAVRRSS